MMYAYIENKQSYRYLDVLQDLVKNYNATPHRALKFKTPLDVHTGNEHLFWYNLYIKPYMKSSIKPRRKFNYKVGDKFRLSHLRSPFKRGYNEQYSAEVYIIKQRSRIRTHPAYEIKDYNEEQIQGWFYEHEMTKVIKTVDNLWLIDKIMKRRTRAGVKQLYVSFVGFDKKHNSWVDATALNDI